MLDRQAIPTLIIDRRRLEYRVIQPKGAEPALVFLHSGLGSMHLWRDFPTTLTEATGHGGVIYSRQGHGWSDPLLEPRTPRFMHHEALAVLPELLDRLSVSSPILVGHSDGASIALIYAGGNHPVTSLVLLAPHVLVEDESIAGIEATREEFHTTDLPQRLAKYHRDPDATFHAWNDIWLASEFRSWNIEASLAGIDCPVLLIQGEDDEYGTETQLDVIEKGVPGRVERLWLEECGHSPHVEHPDEVTAATVDFVAATAASR